MRGISVSARSVERASSSAVGGKPQASEWLVASGLARCSIMLRVPRVDRRRHESYVPDVVTESAISGYESTSSSVRGWGARDLLISKPVTGISVAWASSSDSVASFSTWTTGSRSPSTSSMWPGHWPRPVNSEVGKRLLLRSLHEQGAPYGM